MVLSEAKRAELAVWLLGFLMRRGTERPKCSEHGRCWTFNALGIQFHAEQHDEAPAARRVSVATRRWCGDFRINREGISVVSITDEEGFLRDIAALRLVD